MEGSAVVVMALALGVKKERQATAI
eukprot:COSAG04_NODE_13165_length_617_cov_1.341699_2_plen_24_part_01